MCTGMYRCVLDLRSFSRLLIGIAALSAIQPASAVILVEEDFSHPDGNLVGQAPTPGPGLAWVAHTDGGNTPIQVIDGMASLSQGSGSGGREDVNVEFPTHQPIDATTYARFDFMLPSSLNSDIINLDIDGSNFAHIKSDRPTNHFRARTGVLAPDGDGDFRLAINANGGKLSDGTNWPTALNFDTTYRVVVNWNAVTGESMLWLNPGNELSPSISNIGHSTSQIMESFALRQSSDYSGIQLVDNLVVATTFTEALLGSGGAITGDLDGDGFVGITDLNLVLSNWNQNPPSNPAADPSGDSFVGIEDLNIVLGNWNAGTPPNSAAIIPEPTSLMLLVVSGVSLVGRAIRPTTDRCR